MGICGIQRPRFTSADVYVSSIVSDMRHEGVSKAAAGSILLLVVGESGFAKGVKVFRTKKPTFR
jgi:hypothetical protein